MGVIHVGGKIDLPGRGQDSFAVDFISLTPSRKVVAPKLKYTQA
jgi:hypothetical protein